MTLPVDFSRQTPSPFTAAGAEPPPERFLHRINRLILAGCAVAGLFVIGAGLWASLSTVTGAVSAVGVVKVENNRKTIKHLEPGIIRQILVHEGDHVKKGQLLFVFDDVQPRAQVAELQSAYDNEMAERARFEAEASRKPAIVFPADLLARRSDPAVAALLASEQALFAARRDSQRTQVEIGRQRGEELNHQIQGVQAQVAAIDAQLSLNKDELGGVQTLYSGGYAPKTRLLALQRSAASLEGSRGEQIAAIARAQQAIGETRTQTLSTQEAAITEAATGLQTTQDKLADLGSRLAAAKDMLSHTRVLSPTDGTVLNLTQFTEGGVVEPNEALTDVVPTGEPLIIEAQIQPRDAHAVVPGQKALVTLTAYNTRTTPRVNAVVLTVSADQTLDPHTGKGFFVAQLRIPAEEIRRLPPTVKMYPGMPVSTSIVNGEKTILQYMVGPFKDVLAQSMHEQ